MKAFINSSGFLKIDHSDFINFVIHPIWLRERLNSNKYLDRKNYQRLYEPSLLNLKIKFSKVFIENNFLNVEFSDDSHGVFEIKSLIKDLVSKDIMPNKKLWKNEFIKLPFYDFNLLNESKYFINLLSDFHKLGFVILENTSNKKGTVINFAEMLGPIRPTNFGKYFDVISKPNPNDLAYTGMGLSAHTDNPYRKPIPGIQLLHCIANEAIGGDSTLVDGLAISEYLRENEKNYFDILTSTDVLFRFTDKDVILENWGKLIELDGKNNFKQIRFSGRLDYVPALDPEHLNLFYMARKKLYELCASKKFLINFRLDSGMLMMFDNHRLLHGRSKYDPSSGNRHLQGCYIEHDATEGKLRRLLTK